MIGMEAERDSFDLVIIGGGPAGTAAASDAAALGKTVALVERDNVGGTCLTRGCIPTKALLYSSSLFEQIGNGATFGISAPEAHSRNAKFKKRSRGPEELSF